VPRWHSRVSNEAEEITEVWQAVGPILPTTLPSSSIRKSSRSVASSAIMSAIHASVCSKRSCGKVDQSASPPDRRGWCASPRILRPGAPQKQAFGWIASTRAVRHGLREDRLEHRRGEAAGVLVVAAGVIGARSTRPSGATTSLPWPNLACTASAPAHAPRRHGRWHRARPGREPSAARLVTPRNRSGRWRSPTVPACWRAAGTSPH
jgi:hypothetical protein